METGLKKEGTLELSRTIELERVSIKDSVMPNTPVYSLISDLTLNLDQSCHVPLWVFHALNSSANWII